MKPRNPENEHPQGPTPIPQQSGRDDTKAPDKQPQTPPAGSPPQVNRDAEPSADNTGRPFRPIESDSESDEDSRSRRRDLGP